jgi:hypothetical protein
MTSAKQCMCSMLLHMLLFPREMEPSSKRKGRKGNIRVCVRVRPSEGPSLWNVGEKEMLLKDGSKTFRFDAVHGPSTSTAGVYGGSIQPVVRSWLGGRNGTVFAFGQTGKRG